MADKKLLWKGTQKEVNELAEYMHDRYEIHAYENGWATQERSKTGFDDLPIENKKTMQDLATDILIWGAKRIQEEKKKLLETFSEGLKESFDGNAFNRMRSIIHKKIDNLAEEMK